MSMHRMKCRNPSCGFEGMMEAKSDQPFMKQSLLARKQAQMKAKGITPPDPVMQVRCPKCGARWKMRANQLH